MPETPPAQPRRLRLRLILLVVAGVFLLSTALVWLNRKGLAREALTGWLKSQGVAARAEVEAFGLTTFTARLSIGDPKAPDFAAERVEVRYHLTPGGLTVETVRLKRPVLRATLRGGRFSVGSLDPLVQAFLRQPPPTTRQPRMEIENGLLLLATDYGPVRMAANAVVDDSKLVSLDAVSAPARLKGAGFDAQAGAARLTARSAGGRVTAELDAPLTALAASGLTAAEAHLRVKADGPYPDLIKRRGEGPLVVAAEVTGRQVAMGGRSFGQASASAGFTGRASGWVADFAVAGRATATLRADAGSLDGAKVGQVTATVAGDDLRWTRAGGDRVVATLRLAADASGIEASGLSADRVKARLYGPMSATRDDIRLALKGAIDGHGRWTGLGAPAPTDTAQLVAVKRAARGFRFAAPAVQGALAGPPSRLTFSGRLSSQPVTVRPDSGGEVRVAQQGDAARITVAGGGLPRVEARVRPLSLAPFTADVAIKAGVSLGMAQGADIDAAGRVRAANSGLTFIAQRCAVLKVEGLDFGANDIERLSGRLCPAKGPLISVSGGDWRIAGRAQAMTATAPFLGAKVTGLAGPFSAASRRGRLGVTADITTALLEDTSPQARFNPLAGSGHVSLAGDLWIADFAVRLPNGPPVGRAHLVHDGGLGVGFVTLDTDTLTFAEGGLQPGQLSPMASAVGSPATGAARFRGRFDWAGIGAGSEGALTLKDLAFASPAGRVEGLNGTLKFVSLAPLTAAPGQTLDIDAVQAIVPLTHLHARFALADNLLKIEGGEALVGGGRVRVESLETPLVPGAPTRGVLLFEGVQLHDLVEASPFGDKVDLDARVSGRIAFEAKDNKVRISAGELKAIQPGRLSIDRAALTGVTADSAIAAPAPVVDPNATFTDFAYQAMENLAFDKLDATIASREDGRLGVLFHIVGKHDPPTAQKIRLSLMDLIQKRFLGRKLPLPSGTGVNLTLDTTLNLDALLADYAEFRRLHGSGGVQP